jgi:hypothetical protein
MDRYTAPKIHPLIKRSLSEVDRLYEDHNFAANFTANFKKRIFKERNLKEKRNFKERNAIC